MLPNILSNDEHCSNLASTAVHAVLNMYASIRLDIYGYVNFHSLSLVLLLFSTSFKLYRILKRHSTKALNFWYLFLGALFNVSQVSIAITGSIVELGTVDCHRYIVHFGLGTLNPLLLLLIHGIILIGSLALCVLIMVSLLIEAHFHLDTRQLRATRRLKFQLKGMPLLQGVAIQRLNRHAAIHLETLRCSMSS